MICCSYNLIGIDCLHFEVPPRRYLPDLLRADHHVISPRFQVPLAYVYEMEREFIIAAIISYDRQLLSRLYLNAQNDHQSAAKNFVSHTIRQQTSFHFCMETLIYIKILIYSPTKTRQRISINANIMSLPPLKHEKSTIRRKLSPPWRKNDYSPYTFQSEHYAVPMMHILVKA